MVMQSEKLAHPGVFFAPHSWSPFPVRMAHARVRGSCEISAHRFGVDTPD